jgi:hypothetical protein
MTRCRLVLAILVGLGVLLAASPARAGKWITPDWPAGKEPQFKPVPLYWFDVKECPLLYRLEITHPPKTYWSAFAVRTSGYVYAYVDGKLVYEWAPSPRTDKSPGVAADPERVHAVSLPGVAGCVLVISAPAGGFVLDGGFYDQHGRIGSFGSDEKWTVTKLAPTTILDEKNPIFRRGYNGDGVPVKTGAEWKADEGPLAAAYHEADARVARGVFEQTRLETELLVRKGIYFGAVDEHGWGGPERIDPAVIAASRELLTKAPAIEADVRRWADAAVKTPADVATNLEARRKAVIAVDGWARALRDQSSMAAMRDGDKRATLAERALGLPAPAKFLQHNLRIEACLKAAGHPIPWLNESRYDRLGWINCPGLVDNEMAAWGVRVNTPTGPAAQAAPKEWRFATDPKDAGLKELRYTVGYNVETQMATLDATHPWTADARFAAYKGVAWYRVRLTLPVEWAGNDVHLTVPVAGAIRTWLNDKELGSAPSEKGPYLFVIPAAAARFGGENVLALRLDASGPTRGLTGPAEFTCPGLAAQGADGAEAVDILATPLSPCVVLTPRGATLELRHAGKAGLRLPGSGVPLIDTDAYDGSKGHNPAGNWALLWLTPSTADKPERPVLLVFEHAPVSIACKDGATRVTFKDKGCRVIAVRPWIKNVPAADADPMTILKACSQWSEMALAVPINYQEVTRVQKPGDPYDTITVDKMPAGPVLGQTIVYDYLETKDDWGTKPLRVAPVPALCSYAIDKKFRGLVMGDARNIESLQDGGQLAPYRAVLRTDRVTYSYPVEPYPRLVGFTSWMFGGTDAGVPGNKREMELVAWLGANSYRPQHNWSDEQPPDWLKPGDGRTRVQITSDYCRAAGINYMNNIDETLGRKSDEVRADYDKFMGLVYSYFGKLVPQLAGRAFWEVSYDLINEPFDHKHEAYNAAMKELTRRIRTADKTHLLCIEPCEAWGAIQQLSLIEPTGDPLTLYSFHDYNFRLMKPSDLWPTPERDISSIYQMWLPAIKFQIEHGAAMHCGEYGGFNESTNSSPAQRRLMADFFRVFDQFGMHHHYYSGRTVFDRLADGSLRPSLVARAFQEYAARPDLNAFYKKWPGYPEAKPSGMPPPMTP